MATDKLFPAYAQIAYHSPYGNHVMTLPIKAITTTGLGDAGTAVAWDTTVVDVRDMVEAMIDDLIAANPSSIVFDRYTIFKVPAVGEPGQPIFTNAVTSGAGTETGLTGQEKAVQVTIGFLTTSFGQSRIVLLDRPVNGNFGNFVNSTGDLAAVISNFISDANAWSGRDNSQPAFYTNTSITLNKRLRRKYGMV